MPIRRAWTGATPARRSKYGNSKTGEGDSKAERKRLRELQVLERAGAIWGLRCQVKFVLIPAQRNAGGKLVERECSYRADFVYIDSATGLQVVEDVKGVATPEYVIKRKLMRHVHGIAVVEIKSKPASVLG